MRKFWLPLLASSLLACGDSSAPLNDNVEPATAPVAEKPMPPGFLDTAPAPPSSDTIVLSGGDLVADVLTPDSAIVLHKGVLMAWGKRGEVNMPNDSAGKDMRGKWVAPGTIADLEAGTLPNVALLKPSAPANLLIFKVGPDLSQATEADLHGIVADGELQIFESASD